MKDEIVPELAWQMGRPVRYGGELRGFEERARYMIAIAERALEAIVPDPRTASGALSGASRWAWSSSSRPGTIPI